MEWQDMEENVSTEGEEKPLEKEDLPVEEPQEEVQLSTTQEEAFEGVETQEEFNKLSDKEKKKYGI